MDLSRKIDELLCLQRKLVEAQQEAQGFIKENGDDKGEHDAHFLIVYLLAKAVGDTKRAILNSVIGPE